jgi:4'-phosphopantetheinyl transferase
MVTDTGLRDDQIEILNQPSGMPFVTLEGRGNWPFSISISHRQEAGFAAAPLDSCGRIGADLETIEPRAPALVRQFFTEAEAASLEAAGGERDVSVARLWSAKEAVLKVLGLGLRVDTRAIEVNTPRNEIFECPEGWLPLEVKLSGDLVIESLPQPLRVVWRREGPYVLTLAVAG